MLYAVAVQVSQMVAKGHTDSGSHWRCFQSVTKTVRRPRAVKQVDTRVCCHFHGTLETGFATLVRFMVFQVSMVFAPGEEYARGWGRNIGGCKQTQEGPSSLPVFS